MKPEKMTMATVGVSQGDFCLKRQKASRALVPVSRVKIARETRMKNRPSRERDCSIFSFST